MAKNSSKRKKQMKKKASHKLFFSKRFKKAVTRLKHMSPVKQKNAIANASNAFIRDISTTVKKIRNQASLVKPHHRKILRRHKKILRKLINPKVSLAKKRLILMKNQKGGIAPFLIPIIAAIISAVGGVGGAAVGGAVSAAVAKS